MTVRSFVDTNVLVYAVDSADPAKQATARAVLTPSSASDFVVSAQVLGEFYVTVTRKLKRPVAATEAERMVQELRRLPVVAIDADDVLSAVAWSQEWGISYWDSLVVASARTAGCERILSEDLADGRSYGGVRVENPFRRPHHVSEEMDVVYQAPGGAGRLWSELDLSEALHRYERAATDAGMTPNAVHSYWDYARRFLAWRTGDYRPRGTSPGGRPVPTAPTSVPDLAKQAASYARAIEWAGREPATVETYHRHAMFFVRWLDGDFDPGRRLHGSWKSSFKPRGEFTRTGDHD